MGGDWNGDVLGAALSQFFPTLQSKTFFILAVQLLITWLGAMVTLSRIRAFHRKGVDWLTAKTNDKGQVDLVIKRGALAGVSGSFAMSSIVLFLLLLFWGQHQSLLVSTLIFAGWSLLTGAVIAIALINVDENLGANALGLTVMIVLAAAMVTHHYPMDMSFLRNYLLLALLALIVFSIVRLLMNIPRWLQRIGALFGVILFTTYLLYDFDMLAAKQAAGINTWQAATHMAIELYLDIINLLLELLDALSD
ncbi:MULTISPECIES: Bax inhibitor-1 family protein [Asticcacaulis]|uniref:Bax inhibitor-1 family protein n=1 Tax=Asticcacaulis TaxID=76890 RepID=UPI001AE61AE4|nr:MULTISPECIES: Bax inhibitor-1 family protein [Asticcacaulis]MBP2160648.1 FtsH-binding integral membrane protein [Asticcacaulis solisilvae]MDR6801693.1 FtsH-binding integral membrane protein [Asticcacaulis sp. BE141]